VGGRPRPNVRLALAPVVRQASRHAADPQGNRTGCPTSGERQAGNGGEWPKLDRRRGGSAVSAGSGLLDERVVMAQPSLIRAFGPGVALVLQQIHWHTQAGYGAEVHDGETWWPVTISEFADEIGLSPDQMRRTLNRAEDDGLLVSCQPEGWRTRRKWYRVDRDVVRESVDGATCPSGESAASKRANPPLPKRANPPLPKRANPPLPPMSEGQELENPDGSSRIPSSTSGSRSARRTDSRADAIVREWWERFTPAPLQPWPAAIGVVSKALRAGWEPDQVARALRAVDPPLSTGKLDAALSRQGMRERGRRGGTFDDLQPRGAA
jgi:hypothetical protein